MNGGFRVRLRLSGLGVEKLLNQGWNKGIRLKRVKRGRNRSVTVECTPEAAASLTALAREKGYRAEEYRPVGLLKWARLLGRRWGLLLGTAVCVALMVYALGFVWQVRIENAGAYEGEVRACLEEWGIVPGIRRSQVHPSALRDQLEWRFPRVQWVQVEWAGVALRVRLEEGVPPPQVETAGKNGDVVAAEDGCLLRLTAFAGTPAVRAGDFVRAGQVLIRGEERGADGTAVPVKARGEAMARVWVSVSCRLPLIEYASHSTGRTAGRRVIVTPFFSWSPTEAPDNLTWDRKRTEFPVGGVWLPVSAIRDECSEVYLEKQRRSLEEVKQEGARAADFALRQALITDEIVDKWINFSMIEEDTMTVTATAEVRRDIARYRQTEDDP